MCRWWLCGETICLDAGAVRHSFYPWVGKKPWRRARRPTPAFLPGESPGPRCRLAAVHRSRRVGHDWSDLARTDHVSLHRYYNISTETLHCFNLGLPGGSVIKSWLANSGDVGSIPGLGRSPAGGNGNPLQCSWLENPMDRGAWWATVHGVAKELNTTEWMSSQARSPALTLETSICCLCHQWDSKTEWFSKFKLKQDDFSLHYF